MQTYRINPTVPRGYVLNDVRGAFGVVVPEATVNIVINPSLETATTDWSALNTATLARSSDEQWAGNYSLRLSNVGANGGAAIFLDDALRIISGQVYTASAYVLGEAGKSYQMRVSNTGTFLSDPVIGTGRWQRLVKTFVADGNQFMSVGVIQNAAGGQNRFYIDAVQLEQKPYATTYVDGDRVGFVKNQTSFFWNGTPHASTSTRTAQTRAGGKVIMFDSIGWKLLSIIGLSMLPVSVLSQPLATGGGYYQTTLAQERAFSLVGDLYGTTEIDLQRRKDELVDCLNPFLTSVRQPLVLLYQRFDRCGKQPISEACEVVCHYTGGMEGTTDNNYHERIAGEFRMFLPAILKAGDTAETLLLQSDVVGGSYIAQRSTTGQWDDLDGGTLDDVQAIVHISGSEYYIGGEFTQAGGVANTSRIAKWDGTTWTPLGTGALNGAVLTMALAANGDLYVAGTFTQMGGVANTSRIARWNGSAWSALGSGLDNTVTTLEFGTDGSILYAGGLFLNSGATPMARIATYTVATNTWTAMGAGANSTVNTIHRRTYGEIYIGGAFTSIDGVAANRIAVWNGTTFAALGTGANAAVNSITSSPGGLVYAGGAFTTIGGVAVGYIAAWNGTSWAGLGVGADAAVTVVHMDDQGLLYVAGSFTTIGGLARPDRAAIWTGTTWLPLDLKITGTASINVFETDPSGVLTIGHNSLLIDFAAGLTTGTNSGSADAYPVITIFGPTSAGPNHLWQIVNNTTGAAIYLDLSMAIGEVLTLTLDPTNISFESSFRGNIISAILPGSTVSGWYLQPGANTISLFAENFTTTATIRWRESYLAIENTVIR